MTIRSRAPLRIGFAGGGTDLESFSNLYGGAVFCAAVSMYAHCTIIPSADGKIRIHAADNRNDLKIKSMPYIESDGDNLILHRGTYNRVVKEFNAGKPLSFTMSTSNDAPVGSGLGTSSTMIVAMLEAYRAWLGFDISPHEMAELAFDIERNDLHLAGGRQDQYSAVFGGFNLFEFKTDRSAVVNRVTPPDHVVNELESSLLLYYSGKSRRSAQQQMALSRNIIHSQIRNASGSSETAVDALHRMKEYAYSMESLFKQGSVSALPELLNMEWEAKKKTSDIITNADLDKIINYAMENGTNAVKVSGAGGGGFLLLYCDPIHRQKLIDAMRIMDGVIFPVRFTTRGAESWFV